MLKKIGVVVMLWLAQVGVQAADLPSYPFVHVSGSGMSYALPDVGEIDFEVSVVDADPVAARALMDARLGAVRALMATHAVPEGDITVRDVRRDMPKGQTTSDTYRLRCNVRIRVLVLASWGRIVTGLLAMPNLDEFGVAFDILDRSKIEGTLMAEALKDARKKATDIAAGVGRKLGLANGVSTGEVRNVSRAMGLMAGDEQRHTSAANVASDRDTLATIEMIKLLQTVDVLFSLK